MASPRKHPSLYPKNLTELLLSPSISLNFPTRQQVINFRYQLYAFREALRKHPDYNPTLLTHVNAVTLKIEGSNLHIIKSDN